MRYAGLDVHKRLVQAHFCDEQGHELQSIRFELTAASLSQFAHEHLGTDCLRELRQCGGLDRAVEELIRAWDPNPRPFVWQARAQELLEKLERAQRRLEDVRPGCTARRGHKATSLII